MRRLLGFAFVSTIVFVAVPVAITATSRPVTSQLTVPPVRSGRAVGSRPAGASSRSDSSSPAVPSLLSQARAGFTTHLTVDANARTAAPTPPATSGLNTVEYPSAVGNLVAYLTSAPNDGRKHPAIIWITGGDNNTIDDVWTPQPADNDQTAAAYRKAGIVTMYPSQRRRKYQPWPQGRFPRRVRRRPRC